jgi:hypothetical protein
MRSRQDPYAESSERRHRRWPWVVLGVLVLLVLAVRLAADPLAAAMARRGLAELDGYDGNVARVHVTFVPPGSVINRLKVTARDARPAQEPLLYVERVESRVAVAPLFRGVVQLSQKVEGAKLTVASPLDRQSLERLDHLIRRIPRLLRISPQARVADMELTQGELLFIDTGRPERPRLWIHDLGVEARDLVTRPGLAQGRPMVMSMSGRVQRSGVLASRLSIPQPQGHAPSFDWRLALSRLSLQELHDQLAPRTGVKADQGTLDTYAAITARDGRLGGWMRPVMQNVELAPADRDLGDRVKAWLADKTVDLFAEDKPAGGERLARTIPIHGQIDPDRPIYASVLEVLQRSMKDALAATTKSALGGEDKEKENDADAADAAENSHTAAIKRGHRQATRRR